MTTARTTAALLLVAAAIAAIAALLMPSPAAHADTHTPTAEAVSGSLAAPDATAHGTGVGADLAVLSAASPAASEPLTAEQSSAALLSADRVCEGLTAGVPEGMMIRTVADESGLPLADAHAFVEAAMTRCGAL